MLDALRLARIVKQQRRQVARRADLAAHERRRLVLVRHAFKATLKRKLSRPMSMLAIFSTGFLLGPPHISASRRSLGSLAALVLTVKRALDALHRIGLVSPADAEQHVVPAAATRAPGIGEYSPDGSGR